MRLFTIWCDVISLDVLFKLSCPLPWNSIAQVEPAKLGSKHSLTSSGRCWCRCLSWGWRSFGFVAIYWEHFGERRSKVPGCSFTPLLSGIFKFSCFLTALLKDLDVIWPWIVSYFRTALQGLCGGCSWSEFVQKFVSFTDQSSMSNDHNSFSIAF